MSLEQPLLTLKNLRFVHRPKRNFADLMRFGKTRSPKRELWRIEELALPQTGIQPLLGKNGSGKSTLLKVIIGQLKPSQGEVLWNDTRTPDQDVLISYLPEFPVQVSGVNVREWLAWYHGVSARTVTQNAPEILSSSSLEIEELLESSLQTLSKGQLQRVMLWQALYSKPHLLVLDEPFSGLDPWHKDHLVDILIAAAQETCLLISTHEVPNPLRPHCKTPWVIDPCDGKVVMKPLEEILP